LRAGNYQTKLRPSIAGSMTYRMTVLFTGNENSEEIPNRPLSNSSSRR